MSDPTNATNQIEAGISLIDWSHLAVWNGSLFEPTTRDVFENHHRTVHGSFGRLICWLQFSVGAEYLAKGFCLVHEIEPETSNLQLVPPVEGAVETWIKEFMGGTPKKELQTIMGAFNKVLVPDSPKSGKLSKACDAAFLIGDDKDRVLAGYSLLISTIRNRDAHWFKKNVRNEQFYLSRELFVPSFNAMCKAEKMRKLLANMGIVSCNQVGNIWDAQD